MSDFKRNGPREAYTIPIFKCRLVRERKVLKMSAREIDGAYGAAAVFMRTLRDLPHEEMHAVFLNAQSEIVGFQVLSVGGVGGTALTPADVFRGAIAANARAVILGHNHPSGSIAPSAEDISTTIAIRKAGQILGIELLDHLVCAPSTERWRSIIDLAPLPA